MPKYELSKADSIKHSKVDRVKHTRFRPYTKNYTQVRNIRGRRDCPPQGRAYQLVVLCWMVIPGIIHEVVSYRLSRNVYAYYIYML